jgi:type IV secretory pathway TrbL component
MKPMFRLEKVSKRVEAISNSSNFHNPNNNLYPYAHYRQFDFIQWLLLIMMFFVVAVAVIVVIVKCKRVW